MVLFVLAGLDGTAHSDACVIATQQHGSDHKEGEGQTSAVGTVVQTEQEAIVVAGFQCGNLIQKPADMIPAMSFPDGFHQLGSVAGVQTEFTEQIRIVSLIGTEGALWQRCCSTITELLSKEI